MRHLAAEEFASHVRQASGRDCESTRAILRLGTATAISSPEEPLKFGILHFFSWPDRRVALPTVYKRALQRIEIMESAGYDAIWLTEHHFSDYSVCPSIPVMGAYAAARTKRLRIGTAVTLAALYHPVRLAEEIALLDVLSNGRVNWGAGRGFDEREFRTFGVTPEQSAARLHEAVDIVLRAWKNEELNYRGEFFSFDNIEVLPKPLQKPHPPMWIGASSNEAVRWAATAGHSILMTPHNTHAEIGEQRRFYAETLAKHGHSMSGRVLPVTRLIAIASNDSQAEQVARDGVKWLLRTYVNPTGAGNPEEIVKRYVDSVVIHGTVEKVVAKINELRETIGLDYLIGAPLSHETFITLTERVLPAFF